MNTPLLVSGVIVAFIALIGFGLYKIRCPHPREKVKRIQGIDTTKAYFGCTLCGQLVKEFER